MPQYPAHTHRGHLGIAVLAALSVALTGCPESPLAELIDARLNPQPAFSLKQTPFGAMYTAPRAPASTEADIAFGLDRAGQLGTVLGYVWEWGDGEEGLLSASSFARAARDRNMKLLLQLSVQAFGEVRPPPELSETTFTQRTIVDRFVNDALRLAALEPDWLVLGTQVNALLRNSDDQYDAFAYAFREAYAAVKAAYPDVAVGASFDHGLLLDEARFRIVDQLHAFDFIGVATYPDSVVLQGEYESVSDIPTDLFDILRQKYPDRPIAITEIGYTSLGQNGPADQAHFIERLPELLAELDPVLVCWAKLHDTPAFDLEAIDDEDRGYLRDRFEVDNAEVLYERLSEVALLTRQGELKPGFFAALDAFGATALEVP